jgi:hypothetical protein
MKLAMWRLLDSMTMPTAELASNGEVLTVELHDEHGALEAGMTNSDFLSPP